MQIFLAAAAQHTAMAAAYTGNIAHAAYRIGKGGHLAVTGLGQQVRGGMLLLSDRDCPAIPDQAALCREIRRECELRHFRGVAADFELPPNRERAELLRELLPLLQRSGRTLCIPERYAPLLPQACILISTALSGGCLRERLEEAAARWGREHIALDLQRLRMSFPIPCPTGCGTVLSREELETMLAGQRGCVYYSTELAAKYFTCREGGGHRFVLFDDSETLLKKAELGREMKFPMGFLLYPEVAELLDTLFPAQKSCRLKGGSCALRGF